MMTEHELDLLLAESFKEKQPAQIGDELRRLLSVLNHIEIKNVLEIGSEEGGTIRLWTKLFPALNLFCIDANTYSGVQGKRSELEASWRSWCVPGKQTLNVVWGDSHSVDMLGILRQRMWNAKVSSFDLVFIDGDHSENGVRNDHAMYSPFVRKGGVVVHNDIHPYPGRDDMQGHKWWKSIIGDPISQDTREYHPGARPNYIEIFHDKGKQRGFGFGVVFI